MRVLGIDCGTERTGWGVIDSDGKSHQLIGAGVIETRRERPLPARLLVIMTGLREVIREYGPSVAAVEDVFFSANARSALKLAQARGAALVAAAEAGLDVGEYTPSQIKSSVVGYGRADKRQVQRMVKSILRLTREIPSADASDALAAAICHATRTAARLDPRPCR